MSKSLLLILLFALPGCAARVNRSAGRVLVGGCLMGFVAVSNKSTNLDAEEDGERRAKSKARPAVK